MTGLLSKAARFEGVRPSTSLTEPGRTKTLQPSKTFASTALPFAPAFLASPAARPQVFSNIYPGGVSAALTAPSFNPVFRTVNPTALKTAMASNGRAATCQSPQGVRKGSLHPMYALGEAMGGFHPLQALAIRVNDHIGAQDRARDGNSRLIVGDATGGAPGYGLPWWRLGDGAGDEPIPEGHVGHPAVMESHRRQVSSDHYHSDNGYELWSPAGANMGEVVQGRAGDCYWLAALASGVKAGKIHPEQFIRPVKGEKDVYDVYFHKPDPSSPTGWSSEVEAIRVDACLPHVGNGKHIYADGVDTAGDGRVEDAVAIAEKAAAIFAEKHEVFCDHLPPHMRKGYDAIGNGGFPGDAISVLTGEATETVFVGQTSPETIEEILRAAGEEGNMTVIGTTMSPARPLVGRHAYTVLGIEEVQEEGDDGPPKKMVVLRNPWGIAGMALMPLGMGPPPIERAFDVNGADPDWFLDRDLSADAHVDPKDPGQFRIPLEQVKGSVYMVTMNTQSPRYLGAGGVTVPTPKPIVF